MQVLAKNVQPILQVVDVQRSLDYYKEILGFNEGWSWGNPAVHGGTSFGQTSLQFSKVECVRDRAELWFEVDGLDALRARHNMALVVTEIETHPWNHRDYSVLDLDGHKLCFSEPTWSGTDRNPAVENLQIVARKPTLSEYGALIDSVNWRDFTPDDVSADLIAVALHCVMALDREKVIGMAMVMGDAVNNMVIREVVVDPAYHSRGVGTALMARIELWIDANARPGTYITLLCSKTRVPFYAKFGYQFENSGLVGMYRRIPT